LGGLPPGSYDTFNSDILLFAAQSISIDKTNPEESGEDVVVSLNHEGLPNG